MELCNYIDWQSLFDQNWPLFFEMIKRLFFAAICGIAVGWERDLHGRSAGLRTHMLVALGAALFTQLSLITAACPLPKSFTVMETFPSSEPSVARMRNCIFARA